MFGIAVPELVRAKDLCYILAPNMGHGLYLLIGIKMTTFTEEEEELLIEKFKELGVKPKFDTKDDLENWLKEFGGGSKVKVEPMAKVDPVTSVSPGLSNRFPRISLFVGDVKGEDSFPQWMYDSLPAITPKITFDGIFC